MRAMEHFPEKNPNPVLSVEKDCTVLYSNKAAKPLLNEWGVEVGDKLPSYIGDLVQRVISRNSPEKIEVKVEKSVYLVTFQPFPEEECVNIYGFDISDLAGLEEKLRESEEKYRIVADNTFDWEFWLDPDGCFLYTSPSCERVTGYASKEFMHKPDLLLEIIHSDDRQAFLQHKHDMQLSRHGDIEFRIVTKDGDIRWIHQLCQPVYDSKGRYAGKRGSNHDITEHRKAEHQLNNELARATGLYELYTRSSNLSDSELYDFALNQAVKITDSAIGFFHLVSEDEKEIILTTWNQEALRSCTAENEGHYPIEKAGNWVDCVRLKRPVVYNDFPSSPNQKGLPAGHSTVNRFMSVPVSENGKVRIIFGVGNKVDEYDNRDVVQLQLVANELHKIMKLRRIENEVRESEAFLRDIMENVSDAIFVKDKETRMILANSAYYRLMGKSPEEVLNKTVADYHPSEIAKKLTEDDKRVMRTGKVTTFEESIFTSHGWRIFQTVKAPYYDGQGNIIGLIGAARDITEHKQEEHRIRRYNHILEGINWIFNNFMQAKTEEELGEACLSVALKITGSEFGYVIEMGADGQLHDVAKSRLAWEQCHMYDKTGHVSLPSDYVVHGLYGSVIINEKSFFTNDPHSHPDSAGLPPGHPPIKSFLGVPLILDGKTIGSIAVANREGGYSYEQQEDLEAISPAVTQVLQRRKVEQERKLAEQELKASELRFKALVQDLESGVVLIDGEGKFAIHNPAFLQIFNISEQELEHMKIQDLSWDTWNVIDKDGNALWFESHPVQYTRINRKPLKNQVIGIRRYSHENWVWTLVSAEPLLNPDGSINVIICTFTDITQLKNTEDSLKIANETLEEKVKERTVELENAYSTLKEKEELLSDAQAMAHIGNWEWNFVTSKLHWSDEMYRIFRLKPQEFEVNYSLFLSHLHPDDQDYVDNAIKGALSGKPFSIDYRIILANGEERIAHSKGETVFNKESNPFRIRGTTQDITDLRIVEEKIETLANVVESSQDAIGSISLDGNITSWNKGAEQVYGYFAEEILGKCVSTLAPRQFNEETLKLIEKIKQGEKIHQYETLRLRKDGKIINVSITLSPVFDMYGMLTAVSFISRDITERKEAEEKLRESEEKYRNIVETANEGIALVNSEGMITYVNKKMADMLGYTVGEIIGRYTWDFVEDKSSATMILENRRRGITDSIEIKQIRKDGLPLWVHINSKSVFDNSGKFMGSLGMFTDITERKKTEEALINFEIARKKELHHRIKNNLQVISSLLDLQAELFKGRKNIRDSEVLEAFKESMDRVLSIALIHEELYKGKNVDLLNFSQYIKELAENLLLTYSLKTDIVLNFDLEENIFLDMDTAIPLGIAINELITNSFKYAFFGRDKGEIRIKLHREEEGECKKESCKSISSYVLFVSDNGVGIPEDFEIEDLDSLGLQLVTTLVDQLDGELQLKRNNGTEFIIRFISTEKSNQTSSQQPNS
jgi:PAS domain S-box-containing protein